MRPQLKEKLDKAGEEVETGKGVSPWEADYQLLVCEGLFSEYLEMGNQSLCFLQNNRGLHDGALYLNSVVAPRSASVWFHYHLCGSVSSRSALRSHQQLGGDTFGRAEIRD